MGVLSGFFKELPEFEGWELCLQIILGENKLHIDFASPTRSVNPGINLKKGKYGCLGLILIATSRNKQILKVIWTHYICICNL